MTIRKHNIMSVSMKRVNNMNEIGSNYFIDNIFQFYLFIRM